ncbi:MAG: hypothetical protein KAS29_01690, partial [Bacteroidales bacterium]|nr:hypothetical protein [Bacteroidales bacterium]
VIVSWIYDIHPEGGIVKTEAVKKVSEVSIPPSSKGWKIASYISFVVIVALIVLNIIPRTGKKVILDKSIAVLPFESLSDDPEKHYQADGAMDAILLHLSRIEDLRVISRTSVEQYRATDKTIKTICEELDVAYILEGSFQKYGDQVRLIVQLIQSGDYWHVWANNYDREWKDIFNVQSEVARAVAKELMAVITPEEKVLIEKIPTQNLIAYDYYQRGREEYWRAILNMKFYTTQERAEYFFNKALEYDPNYALAYSGLAMVQYSKYVSSTRSGVFYEADYYQFEILDSVRMYAEKALSIDNQIADAYYAKGRYEYEKGQLREAMALMQKALAFDPNHTAALTVASDISAALFDYVTALELLFRATELERESMLAMIDYQLYYTYLKIGFPELSLLSVNDYLSITDDSIQYYFQRYSIDLVQGNHQEAFESIKTAYAIDSNDRDLILFMGIGLLHLERYEEAYPYFSKYFNQLESSGELNVNNMNRMGYLLWMLGKKEEAKYYFLEMIDHCTKHIEIKSDYGQSGAIYDKAGVYAFLGENDSAYYYLEDLFKVRWHQYYISMLKSLDPLFESIR